MKISTLARGANWVWPQLPMEPIPTEQEIRSRDVLKSGTKRKVAVRDNARLRLNACQISISLARELHARMLVLAKEKAAAEGKEPNENEWGLFATELKQALDDRMGTRVIKETDGREEAMCMKRRTRK